MKKITLLILIFIVSSLNAQISLHNVESNSDVNEGDIVNITQDGITTHFVLTNNYNHSINLKLTVVSITNTDGSELGLCFGVAGHGHCVPFTNVGATYDGGAELAAGTQTGPADIDFTHTEGTTFTNYPKDYVLKISALDPSNNNTELSHITFTYRFTSTGNVNTFTGDMFSVISLPNYIKINTEQNVKILLFDLTGKEVKEFYLEKGIHQVFTDNLHKGIYFIKAVNEYGQITKKIIL